MNEWWSQYFKTYPLGTIQDFIKFLYQSILGSAHLVVNAQDNYEYLLQEYDTICYDANHVLYEEISEDLVRVHLEAIPKKHLKTMHTLFMKSVHVRKDRDALLQVFQEVEIQIKEKKISFSLKEWQNAIKEYIKVGCPVVSHSETFRQHYHPHYRLMKKEYIKYIDVLFQIEELPPFSVISIDGCAAAGKSSFANFLQEIFQYPIIHMDDFFLQPSQRTRDRLQEAGGNIDYERFFLEVVQPLQKKQSFSYQVFDCSVMKLNAIRTIEFKDNIIVEGSYAHHPYFKEYSSLHIFMDVNHDVQIERIAKRNGEDLLQRFIKEWIPMEKHYFETYKIKEHADCIIK